MSVAPICPGCSAAAELTTGAAIYPRRPDLASKSFWRCAGCDAYVGCHPGTTRALGTPADAPLRSLRSMVHAEFDPLWLRDSPRNRFAHRSQAYAWLARGMGLPTAECHIGMFNHEQCERALQYLYTST